MKDRGLGLTRDFCQWDDVKEDMDLDDTDIDRRSAPGQWHQRCTSKWVIMA